MNQINKFNLLNNKVMFGNFHDGVFGNNINPNNDIVHSNFVDIVIHNTS